MTFGCLPVKSPRNAKDRLRHFFSPEQREALARAMFEDVLVEALKVKGLDRLVVVTNDAQALIVAAAAGAVVLLESEQRSHSASADWAAQECIRRGARSLMLIPMDVPLVRAAEMEALLAASREIPAPSLVIVPSEDGTGTNAMVRTPPDVIGSHFGSGSLQVHLSLAKAKGATVRVMREEGLTLDIDEPADVSLFLARNPRGRAAELLRDFRQQAGPSGQDSLHAGR